MEATMIIEEKFDTAKEFLEALRITNPRWISKQNNSESSWIFRGQAKAKWHLIPSAWRSPNLERFKQKYRAKFEEIHLLPLEQELEEIAKQIERGEIAADEGKKVANARTNQTNCSLELS